MGEWVYLKLQPYRQTSVAARRNLKLSSRLYGPFEIVDKLGEVAYRLNLPPGSQIHPVFHVSQLKKRLGRSQITTPRLPIVGPEGQMKLEPVAVLGRRFIKRRNEGVPQLLIRWSNLADSDATWEDSSFISKQFPQLNLGDKEIYSG